MNTDISSLDRFVGCLLGGAVGDALGAPIEFLSATEITNRFGSSGISGYIQTSTGRAGWITDDTQMTLFTAEGLIRAEGAARCSGRRPDYLAETTAAYLRWLATQRIPAQQPVKRDGWLYKLKELHEICAPGRTCINALQRINPAVSKRASNSSKGCGGVMRVAPVGLYGNRAFQGDGADKAIFELGCDLARITHGHPTGFLSAGAFSLLIAYLMRGLALMDSVQGVLSVLSTYRASNETCVAIEKAIDLSIRQPRDVVALRELGEGWIAEESLAIAIYCALSHDGDFRKSVLLSVNHSGDSDSTGSMTGNLLGVTLGVQGIPGDWLKGLELKEPVRRVAEDLHGFEEWDFEAEDVKEAYPNA